MPDILNWFGWCTWDAFYTDVTSQGVKEGLQRLFFSSHIQLYIGASTDCFIIKLILVTLRV